MNKVTDYQMVTDVMFFMTLSSKRLIFSNLHETS